MSSWTIAEWGRLSYGGGPQEIPALVADRIAAAARSSRFAGTRGENVLEHGRHSLRARQYVGVINADGAALEILPKIDGLGDPESVEGGGRVRERLVHMLAVALNIDIASGRIATLGWQRYNLLEVLIRLFVDKLLDEVRLGLPRRYVPHEDDLPALRGRLDVIRQFTSLAVSPQKLACRYDDFSPDILLNRIMKTALVRLRSLARLPETQRRLNELSFIYTDISPLPARTIDWKVVVLDRTNRRWRELLDLARLLLGDRFQTTTLGGGKGFSLLFDMNALFEAYVAAMLKRAFAGSDFRVVSQGGRLFCLAEMGPDETLGKERFQTRPDILLKRRDEILMVIDTKWKPLSSSIEDPKKGVSQADVYQMMAYARLYGCRRLMLLYPHHAGLGAEEGIYGRFQISGTPDQLTLATFDLASLGQATSRLRRLVDLHSDVFGGALVT